MLASGWISAALVTLDSRFSILNADSDFVQTRIAYLVFVVLAFFVDLMIFIVSILNIINIEQMKNIPWNNIVNN